MVAIPIVALQAQTWTNPADGIRNGLWHVLLLVLPAWIFMLLPIHALAYFLCSRYQWYRFLFWGTLTLPSCVLLSSIPGICVGPPPPEFHFEALTKIPFPQSAHERKTYFTGGLLTDRCDTFYFRCSAEDTNNLIRALKLQLSNEELTHYMTNSFIPDKGWPDPAKWEGLKLYRGDDGDSRKDAFAYRFYELLTDESRTQVHLLISNI
ncbi:MAG: hypothetical protein LBV12_02130 [Puniceicoccales bacterium]|nr:hypothetical protein [Puniceicoccales bacterium]